MGSRCLDVLIGQVLYLEAHAFGISARCIGCYLNGAGYFFSLSTCSQLCALSYLNQSPMCTISLFVNNPYMDLDQDCNAHCYNSTGKDFFIVFICMFTFWKLWEQMKTNLSCLYQGQKIRGKLIYLLELQLLLDCLTGHLGEEEVWSTPQISFKFIETTILEDRTIHCSFNLAMADWHICTSSKFCHLSNTCSSYIYCMG